MATTTGQFILGRLAEWGVERIYGYPGDGINGVMRFSSALPGPPLRRVRHRTWPSFPGSGESRRPLRLAPWFAIRPPGARNAPAPAGHAFEVSLTSSSNCSRASTASAALRRSSRSWRFGPSFKAGQFFSVPINVGFDDPLVHDASLLPPLQLFKRIRALPIHNLG